MAINNLENIETQKWKKDLSPELLRDFSEDIYKEKWPEYLESLFSWEIMESDLYSDLEKYAKSKEKYKLVDLSWLKNDLVKKVKLNLYSKNIELVNKRSLYKNYVLTNFKIPGTNNFVDEWYYNKNILPKISKLAISKVQTLIGNKTSTLKLSEWLLVGNYKNKKNEDFLDLCSNYTDSFKKNIEENLEYISRLDTTAENFENQLLREIAEISEKSNDEEFVKKVINIFFNEISLDLLLKYNLVNLNDLKTSLIKKYSIDEESFENVISSNKRNIKIPSFYLSLNDLTLSWFIYDLLNESWELNTKNDEKILDENNTEVSNLEDLRKYLLEEDSLKSKISLLENLSTGNFIEVNNEKTWKNHNNYLEIKNIDFEKQLFSFYIRWKDEVYIDWDDVKSKNMSFSDFIAEFSGKHVKHINFQKRWKFLEKVSDWTYKRSVRKNYITKNDIDWSELVNRNELISTLIKDEKISDESGLDNFLQNTSEEEKKDYNYLIDWLKEKNVEEVNLSNMINFLDSEDSDWKKHWFWVWVTFTWKKDNLYTVENIDFQDDTAIVSIVWISWRKEEIVWEDFMENFSDLKSKRVSSIKSFDWLKDEVDSKESIWWEEFSIKNNTINKKTNNEKLKDYDCDILVWAEKTDFDSEHNIIKIHSNSWRNVTVSFWVFDWKKYSIWQRKEVVDIWVLSHWIREWNLKPRNLEKEHELWKIEASDINDKSWNLNKSLKSKYVNDFISIWNVVSLFKMYGDFYKNYFEEWDKEKAERLLSKLPVFTKEQKSARMRYKDNNEKKRMDEFIEKLKGLDSGDAVEDVERWITDANSSQAQKEAALFFMIEKYGVLYEKWPMHKHKGSFLWYRALGGRVWDELFNEQKARAENSVWWSLNFTEEDLVYMLLNKQCKDKLKPKRRWKLYKEYEAIIWRWRSDEIEKWEKDASKKRNFDDRLWFALSELKDGWWPNAIWAFKAIMWKWDGWNITSLNKLPFVMMTSWVAYSFDQWVCDQFKNSELPSAFFLWRKNSIDLFNKTFVSIAYDIQNNLWWIYRDMWTEADKLINKSAWKKDEEKINLALEFFDKHDWKWWETITRTMLKLNSRKVDKEAEFETWLADNKDNNSLYKNYLNNLNWWIDANSEAKLKNTDLFRDWFKSELWDNDWTWWSTAWWTYELVRQYMDVQSWGSWFRNSYTWEQSRDELIGVIDSIKNNYINWNVSKEKSIRRLKNDILIPVLWAIQNTWIQRDNVDEIFDNPWHVLYNLVNIIWAEKKDFQLWTFIKPSNLVDDKLDEYVNNILLLSVQNNWEEIGKETSENVGWILDM